MSCLIYLLTVHIICSNNYFVCTSCFHMAQIDGGGPWIGPQLVSSHAILLHTDVLMFMSFPLSSWIYLHSNYAATHTQLTNGRMVPINQIN